MADEDELLPELRTEGYAMSGCSYFLSDGTHHVPTRKKPVIVLREPNGNASGYAIFHDEASMESFIAMFDRVLKPKVVGE